MNPIQMTGTVLFAVGAVLLWFAYGAWAYGPWNAPLESGFHIGQVTWYLIAGTVAAVGGAFMARFGRRHHSGGLRPARLTRSRRAFP